MANFQLHDVMKDLILLPSPLPEDDSDPRPFTSEDDSDPRPSTSEDDSDPCPSTSEDDSDLRPSTLEDDSDPSPSTLVDAMKELDDVFPDPPYEEQPTTRKGGRTSGEGRRTCSHWKSRATGSWSSRKFGASSSCRPVGTGGWGSVQS